MGAQERRRILVLDDEEDLLRWLQRKLTLALPDIQVIGETSPERALAQIKAAPLALVITDVRMPGLSGLELVFHARERWPELPFIVMTAFPAESLKRDAMKLGSVRYVEKPFGIDALLPLVLELLKNDQTPGFSGAVSAATLPDLMQLFFMSNSTGALRVWNGEEHATLYFDRGSLIHAEAGRLQGREAVFEIISWEAGEFSMDLNAEPPARTVDEGTTGLMLEALRRLDEQRSGRTPAADDIEIEEVSDLDVEFYDPTFGIPDQQQLTEGVIDMPNVNSSLEKLRAIDGYIGACVVDSESAMSLGSDGGVAGGLNLDVASAGNAEVVKAKRKVMRALGLKDEIEDILISLGRQYHLIRPLRARPAVFIYVAVDRAKANLAMARMIVADVERALEF